MYGVCTNYGAIVLECKSVSKRPLPQKGAAQEKRKVIHYKVNIFRENLTDAPLLEACQ